jgi:hypothetical protein
MKISSRTLTVGVAAGLLVLGVASVLSAHQPGG